jgi:hypothetical protein
MGIDIDDLDLLTVKQQARVLVILRDYQNKQRYGKWSVLVEDGVVHVEKDNDGYSITNWRDRIIDNVLNIVLKPDFGA